MKSNIDLTSNQIFSSLQVQHGIGTFQIDGIMFSIERTYSPFIDMARPEDFRMREIVKTGNRMDRHIKVIEDRCEVGGFCDCCGRELAKTPWSVRFGLCRNCEIELGVSKRRKSSSLDINTNMIPNRSKIAIIRSRR